MIGQNSIIVSFKTKNTKQPKYYFKTLVQANRNFGVCDVILPIKYMGEDAERKAAEIRTLILDECKGQQINDTRVYKRINDLLYLTLN